MKQVKHPGDVPKGHHYAVLKYDQRHVHHEGDERSRTHPGHGYPAHTETFDVIQHYVTEDKADWEAFISENIRDKDRLACLEVNRKADIVITTTVKLDIK